MLETQDWWTATGALVEGMSQHIHLSTCFPLDQTVRGTVPFDLHVQLHMNPGVLTQVDLQIFGNNVDLTQVAATPNYTCPTAQCDLWYHLEYDTTAVPVDGYLEFRFHAKVTAPDGSVGFTSSGWQATLANGGARPVISYRTPPFIEARGWYTGSQYQNARVTTTLPTGPVSGTFICRVNLNKGSGGSPVNHVLVSLDPKFHADPVDRGRVVLEQSGPYTGAITIDTTTLSNGVHKLFMRSDSTIAAGTGSGVLVVLFRVDNGLTAASAMATASDVLQTSAPLLPWGVLLVLFALNFPWRAPKRGAMPAGRSPIQRRRRAVFPSLGRIRPARSASLRMGNAGPSMTLDAIEPIAASQPASQRGNSFASKDATWLAYRRAMAETPRSDGAEAAARAWLESVDRAERWG